MFKRGDMKKIFETATVNVLTVISISVVTLKKMPAYDTLESEGKIHVTVLD